MTVALFRFLHRWPVLADYMHLDTRSVALLDDRDRELEDYLAHYVTAGPAYVETLFSQVSLALQESGRYYPPFDCELYEAAASVRVAGSTTTSVAIKVNGTTEGTVSLVASDNFQELTMSEALVADTNYVTVETTAVGTGATDLVVALRFRRSV